MTGTAVQDDTAELTAEQTLAEEEAGFNSTETPTVPDTGTPAPEAAATPPGDEPAPSPDIVAEVKEPEPAKPVKLADISEEAFQNVLAKLTEVDQIKAALAQRFDGVNGKVGGLERVLRELQAKSTNGKPFQISKEDMKELIEEFPLFGEHTITGLNRALAKMGAPSEPSTPVGDKTPVDLTPEAVQKIVEDAEKAKEVKRLTKRHSDWAQVIGPVPDPAKPEIPVSAYRQWLKTQPAEYQTLIDQSRDADEIAESLEKFKKTIAPKPKPSATGDERARQLRAAIQPRSAGGPSGSGAPTDEDSAMLVGFKAESKARNS